MAFTQVAITGTYRYPDGTPAAGSVVFTPTAGMRNGTHVVEAPRTAPIVAGAISISLAATNDPATTPTGVSYLVTVHIAGGERDTYYLAVPYNGGAIDLDDVARSVEEPTQVVTYLTQAAGDARYGPLDSNLLRRLLHNGSTYPARPAGVPAGLVDWVGPTEPADWLNGDTWIQTA